MPFIKLIQSVSPRVGARLGTPHPLKAVLHNRTPNALSVAPRSLSVTPNRFVSTGRGHVDKTKLSDKPRAETTSGKTKAARDEEKIWRMAAGVESDHSQPHQYPESTHLNGGDTTQQQHQQQQRVRAHSRSVVFSSSFLRGADGKGSYREVRGESVDLAPMRYTVKEGEIRGDQLHVTAERTGGVEVLDAPAQLGAEAAKDEGAGADSRAQSHQSQQQQPQAGGSMAKQHRTHHRARAPQDHGTRANFHHGALGRHNAGARARFVTDARARSLTTSRGANEAVASVRAAEGAGASLGRRQAHSAVMGVPICEVSGVRVGFAIGHAHSDGTATLSTAARTRRRTRDAPDSRN